MPRVTASSAGQYYATSAVNNNTMSYNPYAAMAATYHQHQQQQQPHPAAYSELKQSVVPAAGDATGSPAHVSDGSGHDRDGGLPGNGSQAYAGAVKPEMERDDSMKASSSSSSYQRGASELSATLPHQPPTAHQVAGSSLEQLAQACNAHAAMMH